MSKNTNPITVDCECGSCGGTGIYRGCAEPKGVGVVCLTCKGTGKSSVTYTPFTERKTREGITTVQKSAGSFIGTGVGPVGAAITYQEFLSGKMPS